MEKNSLKNKNSIAQKIPKVVIVGRVNVGKSTLFNRLASKNKSVVSKIAKTTRDQVRAKCSWQGKSFELIDTGGLVTFPKEISKKEKKYFEIEKSVQKQTEFALAEADIILLVCNARSGILAEDQLIASKLRNSKKKVIAVINKADSQKIRLSAYEFYKLGLGEIFPVSAVTGLGVGDLLDKIASLVKTKETKTKTAEEIKIALCGKSNVGKSSLLNTLVGKPIMIVSEVPGTTRDAIDTLLKYKKIQLRLIDTAGIKRKIKTKEEIEKASIKRSIKIIKECDIALLLTDVKNPISRLDLYIAGEIVKNKKGVILVINKWDLIKDRSKTFVSKFTKYLQHRFAFLAFAPVVFVSAKTGENIKILLNLILEVKKELVKEIPKKTLEKFIANISKKHPLTKIETGKKPRILKFYQTSINPPEFSIHIRPRDFLPFSYLRYLEKEIRKNFGFNGVPIQILVKKNEASYWPR